MKKYLFCIVLLLGTILSFAQQTKKPIQEIYKLFSETAPKVKDSLAIYALNFELNISKKSKNIFSVLIKANDTLAFNFFPNYGKLMSFDYSDLMKEKSKIKLIIPILIYGSSSEKIMYKDYEGNPLINLNAAVNAAYALYNPTKYSNIKDAKIDLVQLNYKRQKSTEKWETITLEPIVIQIHNIN